MADGDLWLMQFYNGQWMTAVQIAMVQEQDKVAERWRMYQQEQEEEMRIQQEMRTRIRIREEQRGNGIFLHPPGPPPPARPPVRKSNTLEQSKQARWAYRKELGLTGNASGDVCKIQDAMIRESLRVGIGDYQDEFRGLWELKRLYNSMPKDKKKLGLDNLIKLLKALKGGRDIRIRNNINSSWFLLRNICNLISAIKGIGSIIRLWDSWMQGEYEEVVFQCDAIREKDLVTLTKLLTTGIFSDTESAVAHIHKVAQRKFGYQKWSKLLGKDHPVPPQYIQKKWIASSKTTTTKRQRKSDSQSTRRNSLPSLEKKEEEKPIPLSNKSFHEQSEMLWSTLWELISALGKHDGKQGAMKLAELKKLYKEVHVKVKDESVERLPVNIISYMQTNGIAKLWQVHWMVCHILAEINFSKDSLRGLWTLWFREKYASLVTKCDEDRFPELISMTKLLGHVYTTVSCAQTISEITAAGEKKYGSAKWVGSIRPFTQFPGAIERVRYIVGGNSKKKATTCTSTAWTLPKPSSSSDALKGPSKSDEDDQSKNHEMVLPPPLTPPPPPPPPDIEPPPPMPEDESSSKQNLIASSVSEDPTIVVERVRMNLSNSLPTSHRPNPFFESLKKKKRREEETEKEKSDDGKSKPESSTVNNDPKTTQGIRFKGPNTSTTSAESKNPSTDDKNTGSRRRKLKRNSNSIDVDDTLLNKPLDPLTVRVPPAQSSSSWWPNTKAKSKRLEDQGTTKTSSKKDDKSVPATSDSSNNDHLEDATNELNIPTQKTESAFEQAKRKIDRSQIQNAKSAVIRMNGDIKEHYLPLDYSSWEYLSLTCSPNYKSLSTKPFGGYNVICIEHYINREVKVKAEFQELEENRLA